MKDETGVPGREDETAGSWGCEPPASEGHLHG